MRMFDAEKLDIFIQSQLSSQRVPGLSITLTDRQGVLFEKAYGFRDTQHRLPVTPDTVMCIASLSKSLTSTCVSLLMSEEKLSIWDPVCKYIPDFKIPGTPKNAVLLHHLMTHTTGLPPLPLLAYSYAAHTARDPGETFPADTLSGYPPIRTAQEIVDFIKTGEYIPLGQPGEYMSYCNEGYALLSTIVDIAADMPLEEYMRRKLFDPLGMVRTSFDLKKLQSMGNITSLFTKNEGGEIIGSDNWPTCPPYRGCAFIYSTSRDMSRYYSMLSQNGVVEGRRILSEDTVERIVGESTPLYTHGVYGYGLIKMPWRSEVLFSHTGGNKGVSSVGGFVRGRGIACCVLANLSHINRMPLLDAAINTWLGVPVDTPRLPYYPSDVKPQEPWIYEGCYGSMDEGLPPDVHPVVVRLDTDGDVLAKPWGAPEIRLLYCRENVFLAVEENKGLQSAIPCRFFVRGDKAWSLGWGTRMLQRLG